MQSKQITMRQRNKEKKLKMSSTLTWLLDWKKRGDLANKTKALTKGERLKNGFGQWETLNLLLFHISLICKLTHTSRAAHIAVKDKGKRSRASLCLCFWEKQKEGEQQQLLVGGGGWTEPAPAPHRRITLERTLHLCSFVELSHFNPRPSPLGTNFNPHPHPTRLILHPGHSALPPSAFPPLCCCSQVRTHKHFHQSHPDNWPASCLSRTPGGVGGCGFPLWRRVGLS